MLVCRGRACWLWLLALSLAVLSACADRPSAEPEASAASAGSERGAPAANVAPALHDAPREMTWEEYYVDVEQRARRKGGFVMWMNPPRPIRRADQAPAQSAAPTGGGAPLSGSVR
jgi:hypothetical protein